MLISRVHPFTQEVNQKEIPVTQQQIDEWVDGGKLIQIAMPNISPDDREFIMTGLLPEDFENFIKK